MIQTGGWNIDILVQGYPGKTVMHGGLGWSTVALLRGHGRIVVLDTGSFGARKVILEALKQRGVSPGDVTDLVLSHLHHDHIVNWPMFGHARIMVGAQELEWALAEPPGVSIVPELYVQALSQHERLVTIGEGDVVLPQITAHLAPGHTPGHLIFVVEGADRDVILVQDAAKYRAELITGRTDMSCDPKASAATIARIWSFWQRKPGSLVLMGHDLPVALENGQPIYQGQRAAGILAILGDNVEDRKLFDLSGQ